MVAHCSALFRAKQCQASWMTSLGEPVGLQGPAALHPQASLPCPLLRPPRVTWGNGVTGATRCFRNEKTYMQQLELRRAAYGWSPASGLPQALLLPEASPPPHCTLSFVARPW